MKKVLGERGCGSNWEDGNCVYGNRIKKKDSFSFNSRKRDGHNIVLAQIN